MDYWTAGYWPDPENASRFWTVGYWTETGHARRRRIGFALATGVRRNLGYLMLLIAPILF